MGSPNTETTFNNIYDETYFIALRFLIAKCNNMSDVEEIMQELYADLFLYLLKETHNPIINKEAFVINIAKKKLAKHYSFLKRTRELFRQPFKQDCGYDEMEMENEPDSILVEETVVNRILYDNIWNLLKSEPQDIQKIFHLYYLCDCPLKSISVELGINLSDVKNKLYRTLKKLRKLYEGGNCCE